MSDLEQPQWNLLPQRPREFFGLEIGFDRTDLKRAYNKWLRRFKPDKSPTEFQRIRAAYEYLESGLRYGRNIEYQSQEIVDDSTSDSPSETHIRLPDEQSNNDSLSDVSTPNNGCTNEPSDTEAQIDSRGAEQIDNGTDRHDSNQIAPRPPKPNPTDWLLNALAESSPIDVYEELARRSDKSARDYYGLAVLSDALDAFNSDSEQHIYSQPPTCRKVEPRHRFYQWIVAGLVEHPTDTELQVLLRHYATLNPFTVDELESLLTQTAESISTDSFYFLTEPMWTRYLSATHWERFQATLAHCESKIRDHLVFSRCTFYVYLLRRAAWKAPLEWLDAKLREIEENQGFIHFHLEQDLELTTQLIDFRRQEFQFVLKGEVSRRIAKSLREFCELDEELSFRTVVATQAFIAANPAQLFEEFKLTPDENIDVLRPWLWVSHGALDRVDSADVNAIPIHPNEATLSVLRELDRTFPSRAVDILNLQRYGALIVFVGLYYLITLPIGILVSEAINIESSFLVYLLIATAVVVYLIYRYSRRCEVWLKRRFFRRVVERHYMKYWRHMIARLFAASHFDYHTIRDSIVGVCHSHESHLHVSTWMPHLYPRDIALVVYSMAVKFDR